MPSLDVMYVVNVVVYVLPESVYPFRSVETKRPFPNAMSVTGPRYPRADEYCLSVHDTPSLDVWK
jgi:hypothetical protein